MPDELTTPPNHIQRLKHDLFMLLPDFSPCKHTLEWLYLTLTQAGFLSYPRTETDIFDPGFDLQVRAWAGKGAPL